MGADPFVCYSKVAKNHFKPNKNNKITTITMIAIPKPNLGLGVTVGNPVP